MDIGEIAARAGVSRSTVSYALSGKRPISAATRARIAAIMRDASYVPNAAAQALKRGTTQALGLAIPSDQHGHLSASQLSIIGAITEAAANQDHDVLLAPGGDGRHAGFERMVGQKRVDGVLLIEVQLHDPRLPVLERSGLPFVAVGHTAEPVGYEWLDLDYDHMVRQCVAHLHELGRQHLVLINRSAALVRAGYGPAVRAQNAFRAEVHARHLRGRVLTCDDSIAASAPFIDRMLATVPDVDGIVTINEAALPTLMPSLTASGKHVPGDISVCGVAVRTVSESLTPNLSGCDLPISDMADQAVTLLLNQIRQTPATHAPALLRPTFIERNSTRPTSRTVDS